MVVTLLMAFEVVIQNLTGLLNATFQAFERLKYNAFSSLIVNGLNFILILGAIFLDLSTPMINFATRHKTAPGSTFKMVSSTAGLMEGVIDIRSRFTCTGIFEKIFPAAKCWAYPSAHGSITVSEAIRHSCNMFFYELGFQLGSKDGLGYSSDTALARLKVYADLYGLTDLSGVEIEESAPTFSTEDGVRSCIGQGTNAYTTVQLARYVAYFANSYLI